MVNRDYTKELGLNSATHLVPWPVGAAIIAVTCGVALFGVIKLQEGSHHGAHKPAAAAVDSAVTK
jgi:hypothetical protein